MKIKRQYVYCLAVSLLLHAATLSVAYKIKMPGVGTMVQEKAKRLFNIKTLQSKLPKQNNQLDEKPLAPEQIKFDAPISQKYLIDKFAKDFNLKKVQSQMQSQTVDVKKLAKSEIKEFQMKEKKFKKEEKDKNIRETRDSLVEEEDFLLEEDEVKSAWQDIFNPIGRKSSIRGETPGFTSQSKGRKGVYRSSKRRPVIYRRGSSPVERKIKYEDLKAYLKSELSVYEDPKDGQKYFKIGIKTGKINRQLPIIPKEIIFLIDTSISINPKRLDGFKKGLKYALKHLNADDRFNLISFTRKIDKFREEPVKPSKENVEDALKFVKKLGGR